MTGIVTQNLDAINSTLEYIVTHMREKKEREMMNFTHELFTITMDTNRGRND